MGSNMIFVSDDRSGIMNQKIVKAELIGEEQKYRVIHSDGKETKSPREIFELCYREITREEIELIKNVHS